MDPVTIEIGSGVSVVLGAGGTTIIAGIFAAVLKGKGWKVERPARNGNGESAGYDPVACRRAHEQIARDIQRIGDRAESNKERLVSGDDLMNKMRADIRETRREVVEIDKKVTVLLDRSDSSKKNRRATDN